MFFNNNLYIKNITIVVKNLNKMVNFYNHIIGLEIINQADGFCSLGVDNNIFINLVENPKATISRRKTGLYHLAILLPDMKYLGQIVKHIAIENEYPITGLSDHLVSNALYLNDLEGNGIEIYADLDPSDWTYADDEIKMATLPVDVEKLLREAYQEEFIKMPKNTKLGHVHFVVNDLDVANNFFSNILGFDLKFKMYDSAIFLSTNNYHHHIGANTWLGKGSQNRTVDMTGLSSYELNIVDKDAFIKRLNDNNVIVYKESDDHYFYDMNNCKVTFK